MRLLFLSNIDDRDGDCATLVRHAARALAEEGHEVTVIAPGDFQSTTTENGPRYVPYSVWPRCCRSGLLFFKALPHIMRNHLVISCTPTFGLRTASLLRRLFYRPYVALVFDNEFERYRRRRFRAWRLRRLYKRACAVITLSGFSRKGLVAFGIAPALIATVRPGRLLPSATTGTPEPHPDLLHAKHVILSVAPFLAGAGQLQLVEALPAVLKEAPGTVLVLPGRGPTLHLCVRRARQLDVRENVLFPGSLDDTQLATLYEACDVFALPSVRNARLDLGVGLALAEALAHGKPVVTDPMSGHSEFVQHEKTGLIVSTPEPEAVAEALIRVLRDPNGARQMGHNALELAQEEFTWRRFARMLLAAVEERR